MMRHRGSVLCYLLLWMSSAAPANELPPVVIKGMESYSQDGADKAISSWLLNSPLKRTGESGALVKMLKNIEGLCGGFKGYETAAVHYFTAKTRFVYVQLNYEACPIFGRFVTYNGENNWVITQINFNAKPEKVLPEFMLVH